MLARLSSSVRAVLCSGIALVGGGLLGAALAGEAAAQPTWTNSVLPNGASTEATTNGVVTDDPLPYNPDGDDGIPGTADDDLRGDEPAGSPLIDAGQDAVALGRDVNGRPQEGDAWDIGPFETFGSALPVELTGLEAQRDGERVRVRWTIASASGHAGFDVERRSAESASWTTVGRVKGEERVSSSITYGVVDESLPAADTLAYRLRQTDLDGTSQTYGPVRIARDAPSQLSIEPPAPNPAATAARFSVGVPAEATGARVAVYDLLGRRVWQRAVEPGRAALSVPARRLSSGTYVVRLESSRGHETTRLTVVR